jgi:hypothetical protein
MGSSAPARGRFAAATLLVLATLGAAAVYTPAAVLTGRRALVGVDYIILHARRMAFAREALLGAHPTLPGWYPRELLGTPFWSNVQNFPFLPTRLLVFLAFPPDVAFAAGVVLAASLSVLFTWCFARRLGLSPLAAATAGFTFAVSGFFASRVMVGHLPTLEVFSALPLLLWLADRAIAEPAAGDTRAAWPRLLALALASGCLVLAGHPQLVVYALAVAALYVGVMGSRKRAALATAAAGLGLGCASVVQIPMLLLVGRSTRVLDLDRAANDWPMPYERLLAFFFPWRDGWPRLVRHSPNQPLRLANVTLYWDTVNYLGLLPWLALLGLVAFYALRRRWPQRQAAFFALVGCSALVLSLPFWHALMLHVPGTILRSPARLLYVVTFALALAAGAGLDRLVAWLRPRLPRVGMLVPFVLLAVHAFDLTSHARAFVATRPRALLAASPSETAGLQRLIGEGRVGIDGELISPHNRRFDDVGFFDSIMLARPYRFVLDTSLLPPRLNEQQMSARDMRPRTLAAAGVTLVATTREMSGLRLHRSFADGLRLYLVDGAAARARFYGMGEVEFVDEGTLRARLRDPSRDPDAQLLLLPQFREATSPAAAPEAQPAEVIYRRPGPDLITVAVTAPAPGYLRVLESWDPGWHASLDGQAVRAVPGNDVFLSVAVPAGRHMVTFEYATPGLGLGVLASLISAVLLALLLALCSRSRAAVPAP